MLKQRNSLSEVIVIRIVPQYLLVQSIIFCEKKFSTVTNLVDDVELALIVNAVVETIFE
jgi:hypothetical protein